jgi:glycosyltransferase involved in cell wall biosynthesis
MLLKLLNLKRRIEHIIILPFILIGKYFCIQKLNVDEDYDVYFFFPFYHTGGAEDVHVKIAQSIKKKSIIYFSRRNINDRYYQEFVQTGHTLVDISKFTDNKYKYWNNLIYRGIISQKINNQKTKPVIFNGQSNFGYKISPWIKKTIPQIDLIHALNSISIIRIPYLKYYTISVTDSRELIEIHKKFYKKYQIPDIQFKNFININMGIKTIIPLQKDFQSKTLNVLYVGRSSKEKRINIFGAIAKKVQLFEKNIHFIMAGDVKDDLNQEFHQYCQLLGNINEEDKRTDIYNKCHILLVTSSTEGGPLVSMEAMQMGLAVISTETGFVANYIQNGENGFKIPVNSPENEIVTFMSEKIIYYFNNREDLKNTSENNIKLANAHFGLDKFNQKYSELISDCQEFKNN